MPAELYFCFVLTKAGCIGTFQEAEFCTSVTTSITLYMDESLTNEEVQSQTFPAFKELVMIRMADGSISKASSQISGLELLGLTYREAPNSISVPIVTNSYPKAQNTPAQPSGGSKTSRILLPIAIVIGSLLAGMMVAILFIQFRILRQQRVLRRNLNPHDDKEINKRKIPPKVDPSDEEDQSLSLDPDVPIHILVDLNSPEAVLEDELNQSSNGEDSNDNISIEQASSESQRRFHRERENNVCNFAHLDMLEKDIDEENNSHHSQDIPQSHEVEFSDLNLLEKELDGDDEAEDLALQPQSSNDTIKSDLKDKNRLFNVAEENHLIHSCPSLLMVQDDENDNENSNQVNSPLKAMLEPVSCQEAHAHGSGKHMLGEDNNDTGVETYLESSSSFDMTEILSTRGLALETDDEAWGGDAEQVSLEDENLHEEHLSIPIFENSFSAMAKTKSIQGDTHLVSNYKNDQTDAFEYSSGLIASKKPSSELACMEAEDVNAVDGIPLQRLEEYMMNNNQPIVAGYLPIKDSKETYLHSPTEVNAVNEVNNLYLWSAKAEPNDNLLDQSKESTLMDAEDVSAAEIVATTSHQDSSDDRDHGDSIYDHATNVNVEDYLEPSITATFSDRDMIKRRFNESEAPSTFENIYTTESVKQNAVVLDIVRPESETKSFCETQNDSGIMKAKRGYSDRRKARYEGSSDFLDSFRSVSSIKTELSSEEATMVRSDRVITVQKMAQLSYSSQLENDDDNNKIDDQIRTANQKSKQQTQKSNQQTQSDEDANLMDGNHEENEEKICMNDELNYDIPEFSTQNTQQQLSVDWSDESVISLAFHSNANQLSPMADSQLLLETLSESDESDLAPVLAEIVAEMRAELVKEVGNTENVYKDLEII